MSRSHLQAVTRVVSIAAAMRQTADTRRCAIGRLGNQRRRYQNAGVDCIDVNDTTESHGYTELLRYDLKAELHASFTHRA